MLGLSGRQYIEFVGKRGSGWVQLIHLPHSRSKWCKEDLQQLVNV